ncbi:MAG: M20/M25/M40 family metallo-hydrolase [Acidobacteriota bacterium]
MKRVLLTLFALTTLAPAQQPDLAMYGRIRTEGFSHSRVMDYASALFDDIGPRLTGSPNLARANAWTRDQFTAMGAANSHLESWGDFGMGWRQISTTVDLASPDTAVFIAQATPWSPATPGLIHADVIAVPSFAKPEDFAAWKGKLKGKVILYGKAPAIKPDPKPLLEHYDPKDLDSIASYPPSLDFREQHIDNLTPDQWSKAFKYINFKEQITRFFHEQGAVAILVSSYAGDGGIMRDDNNEAFGQRVFMPDHKQPVPSAVIANEAFGRISRLLDHNVPVAVAVNINTQFTGDHEQGWNTIAEIPGTDPAFAGQYVLAGGHLDSWIAGTGATDDGAGVIIAMEAMRILTTLHVHPRRTIRVALWSGEEETEGGSMGYVDQHIASVGLSTTPDQMEVPAFLRERTGVVTPKADYDKLTAYFNIDNGGGKLLGIYAEDNTAIASTFEQWIAPLKDLGVTTVTLRPSGSSDQDAFEAAGIPAFQFIQDPRDYETRSAHTNQDTYERLSPDDLKQAAVVEAIFLYNAAMSDTQLPRKPRPTPTTQPNPKSLYPDAKP